MRTPFLVVFTAIATFSVFSKTEKSIIDIYNQQKYTYTDHYEILSHNKFNLFENLDANYPVFSNTPKNVNSAINYYCSEYINTDTFKLEILKYYYKVSKVYYEDPKNSEKLHNLYALNNYDKFIPEIALIEYELTSLYDGLLTLKINYRIQEPNYAGGKPFYDQKLNLTFVKVYYISLRNGKSYKAKDLVSPSKLNQLNHLLTQKTIQYYKYMSTLKDTISDTTDNVNHSKPDSLIDEATEQFAKTDPWQKTPLDIETFVVSITPVEITFAIKQIIPEIPLSLKSKPLPFRYKFNQINEYINPSGPLKSLLKAKIKSSPKTTINNVETSLKQINIIRKTDELAQKYDPFTTDLSYSCFDPPPIKNVKTIKIWFSQTPKDSLFSIISKSNFDKTGKLESCERYNSKRLESIIKYKYSLQNLPTSIITYDTLNREMESKMFNYGVNHNLESYFEFSDRAETRKDIYRKYMYKGNTVLQNTENAKEKISETLQFVLNKEGEVLTYAQPNEEPSTHNIYENGRLVATCFKPRSDNSCRIFNYDSSGKLIYYQDIDGSTVDFRYSKLGILQQKRFYRNEILNSVTDIISNDLGLPDIIYIYSDINGKLDYKDTRSVTVYKFEYKFY